MTTTRLRLFLAVALLVCFNSPASARRAVQGPSGVQRQEAVPPVQEFAGDLSLERAAPLRASVAAGTTVLYTAAFNLGLSCTDQSWTTVDITAQAGNFFHVDDYAGLNAASFAPLDGTKSLWCGARPQASGPLCAYQTLPGYGNGWDQAFETKNCIAVSGDGILDVSFLARFDSEPSYDYTTLEYTTVCGGTGGWTAIDGGLYVWDGRLPATNWLAGTTYGGAYDIGTTGPVRVRLHFQSDGAWSDEDGLWDTDGALHVDDLQAEGLPVEDFEGEAVGATSSDDWESAPTPGYGNYFALFHGTDLLQEDLCHHDFSCVWAAISGSTYNYACGGYPSQAVVPYGNLSGQYLNNEIWSPAFPVTGTGSTINLQFSVYRDLTPDALVFYTWHVRTLGASGCPSSWRTRDFVYYGSSQDWYTETEPIGDLIDLQSADSIQVALGAVDMCKYWCGLYGTGTCHSHAPLFDNVRVYRVDNQGPQWSIRDIDQFQDNFAGDGTLSGTVRADMAHDILGSAGTHVLPGDSSVVRVADPEVGLGTDAGAGGAAVYCYVLVWPQGQADKTGAALTQNATRWPVVGAWTDAGGASWTCLRMDSCVVNDVAQPDYYCVDLNDNLFTPGDTVCFFYCACNTSAQETYAFGSSLGSHGADREVAAANASEFTCLPAAGYQRGGTGLYVDGMDGRGAQQYWYSCLSFNSDKTDRYDVRGPSSAVGNRLASRVRNIQTQLVGVYRQIYWDCGDLPITLGDAGGPEKTDDYQLIDDFLDNLPARGGVFLCGDDVAWELSNHGGAGAITFRTTYLTYSLASGDQRPQFGISPTGVPRAGGIYTDTFIIYGGCPLLNDFDVMAPTGSTTMEIGYGTPGMSNGAVLAKNTTNGNGVDVGVVLAGFSFIYIRDNDTDGVSDRAKFFYDTRNWLGDGGILDAVGPAVATSLSQNYPNPFNPQTTIAFSLRARGFVTLNVYDVAGRLVRTLANGDLAAGAHRQVWDGRNNGGQPVASGVYFYRLVAKDFAQTRKMVLLK